MKKSFNYPLFFLVSFLAVFGLVFLSCLSAPESLKRFGNTNYYLFHELFFGFLPALLAGFLVYKTPLNFFKKWSPLLVLINLLAMFLVFLPFIGVKAGGASRWINLGGFTIQPSEFLKFTAILYLSAWIASKLAESGASNWKESARDNWHNIIFILAPFLIFLGVIAGALFLQRDASTLGIISLTLLALYFSARTPGWHTAFIVACGISALLLMVRFESYRLDRWLVFLHPDRDPLGKGFQLRQQLISLGSGGFFGRGLGMSTEKFGYLPQAMSDSIFAIIGEELGALGCCALICAFVALFWMGLKISRQTSDRFSKMVSIGVVFWIVLQAFINMASVSGIFPLAGIPLPFFTYGGSHLVVELMGIGLLLNISKNS